MFQSQSISSLIADLTSTRNCGPTAIQRWQCKQCERITITLACRSPGQSLQSKHGF